jgi:DUF1680 family protein
MLPPFGGLQQYVIRMWMTDEEGGLAAVLYGASKVRAKVGAHRHEVEIVQETDYPFGEETYFHNWDLDPGRLPAFAPDPRLVHRTQRVGSASSAPSARATA